MFTRPKGLIEQILTTHRKKMSLVYLVHRFHFPKTEFSRSVVHNVSDSNGSV